jgi:chitinase
MRQLESNQRLPSDKGLLSLGPTALRLMHVGGLSVTFLMGCDHRTRPWPPLPAPQGIQSGGNPATAHTSGTDASGELGPGMSQERSVASDRSSRATHPRFRVVGYEESSTGNALSRIQFDKLTHINYAFALPNADGSLKPVPNETKLDAIVVKAHAFGVTVSLSFGGWNQGDDSTFHALASTQAGRATFADAVAAYVHAHQLDGADIDWEYPEAETAADYAALMALLSARLRPAGKLLTAAVGASPWIASGISQDSYQYVDYMMIMAYDDGSAPNHSTYAFAERSLDFWLTEKAVPASKLVLGVPFYSHPNYVSYSAIAAKNAAAAVLDTYDGEYYNGILTIRAKAQLALSRASGVMIWELSQDTNDSLSLLAAIDSVVNP